MNQCERCREHFPALLYGELDAGQQGRLRRHLAVCSKCADEFADLQRIFRLLAMRRRPKPEARFWDEAWREFTREASDSFLRPGRGLARRRLRLLPPRWAFQAASALALIVLGVFIGRLYVPDRTLNPDVRTEIDSVSPADHAVDVSHRIDRYVQRSKLILLEISNLDAKNQDVSEFDFSPEKRVCRELLQEADYLKEVLEGSPQQRMLELISDLEVILLQISNLNEARSTLGIEIVQTGIHRRALLFKINLEEIRRATKRFEAPDRGEKRDKQSRSLG